MTRWPPALRSLSSRNFRLYVVGQGLSLVGTWMQQLAMSWLVFRLTRSAALLGATVFASQIPMLFLAPVAGVLADRLDKRRVVIGTQSLLLLQAAVLAALSHWNLIRVWHVFVLNVFFGTVNSLDMPTRQSMVADLVERKEDLPNAIALMSSVVNVTRLVGPAAAGLVIAAVGESTCFVLNAVSFCAVIVSLFFIRFQPKAAPASTARDHSRFVEGITYAFGFSPIRHILILLAVTSLVGMPYTVLLPIFADRIIGGGASTMGFMSVCSALGALTGSVYLTNRNSARGLLRRVAACAAVFGAGLMGFAMSRTFWVAAPFLYTAGFGVMVLMAACNTVLQNLADDDKRGRVMSLYVTSLMGIAPIGGLAAGFLADHFGAQRTVFAGGVLCAIAGGLFGSRIRRLRPLMRPIYVERGLVDPAEIAARLKS